MSFIQLGYCKYCQHSKQGDSKALTCTLNPEYQKQERECVFFERDDSRMTYYRNFYRDLSESTGTGFQTYLPWFGSLNNKHHVEIKDSSLKATIILGILIASLVYIGFTTSAFSSNRVVNTTLLVIAFGIELVFIINSVKSAVKGKPNMVLASEGVKIEHNVYPWKNFVGRKIEKEYIGIPGWFNRPTLFARLYFIGREKPIRIPLSFQNHSAYTIVHVIDSFYQKHNQSSSS